MAKSRFTIIEAPSVLGLFPKGVETLPSALLGAGLAEHLNARRAGRLEPPPYNGHRDPETLVLNPLGIRDYSIRLADEVGRVLDAGEFPIVLGGDCSIMLGCLLALRRRERHCLLFLDGHADFYQPEAEPNGEVASMELALATGRGPAVLTDLEGKRPLVRDVGAATPRRRWNPTGRRAPPGSSPRSASARPSTGAAWAPRCCCRDCASWPGPTRICSFRTC